MTLQYDQENINLRDASPISIQTPDATAVLVTLGVLTGNGQTLVVNVYGGGSDPADPVTNHYVVTTSQNALVPPTVTTAVAVFARNAGVGAMTAGTFGVIGAGTGLTVLLAFAFVDDPVAGTTTAQLSITGPAAPFNHRLKVSTIQF